MSVNHAEGLRSLKEKALKARPRKLGPDEGAEAFRQHKLLAIEIQRITLLDKIKGNQPESETSAWVRYFERCYPDGRNDPTDARILFDDWRTSLIKNGAPGERVVLTHGQGHAHWLRDANDRLCIDLESMWDDFEYSLGQFSDYLRDNPDRRAIVLDRAKRKGTWAVENFIPRNAIDWVGATVMDVPASAASSISITLPPDKT
jgi:hypothetical protein